MAFWNGYQPLRMFVLLFWGTIPVSYPVGYVADFCRVCRAITPFTVNCVRIVPHFMFIPVGKGDVRGYRQRCHGCRAESDFSRQTFVTVSATCSQPLDELIGQTFPTVREVYASRLALEDRLAKDSDSLTSDERRTLFMESFELGAGYYRKASDPADFRKACGTEGLRLMVLALRPLNPREAEIRACLQIYRQRRERIGARLRTADLMDLLYADRRPRDPDRFEY